MRNYFLAKYGTKFRDVSAALDNLSGIVSIQDIIDAILGIDNFKETTLSKIKTANEQNKGNEEPLSELFVDLTYQRRIRLRKIIKKLEKHGGFSFDGAGVIDIAVRPDGRKFVWDGFRRCLKAGICGLNHIRATKYIHNSGLTQEQCQQVEAKLYRMRNAEAERLVFEEIFKSEVVYKDPPAIRMLQLLNNCNLDVQGLNPSITAKSLSGLKVIWDNSHSRGKNIHDDYILEASSMLHDVFSNEASISSYALIGLSWLLQQNTESDDITGSYSSEEILNGLNNYINPANKNPLKQKALTSQRVNGKNAESVAYHIVKNALNDTNGLMHAVIESDDAKLIEALA